MQHLAHLKNIYIECYISLVFIQISYITLFALWNYLKLLYNTI